MADTDNSYWDMLNNLSMGGASQPSPQQPGFQATTPGMYIPQQPTGFVDQPGVNDFSTPPTPQYMFGDTALPADANMGGMKGGSTVAPGQIQSVTANPSNPMNALMQSLMTEGQKAYTDRMKQYKALLASITGKGGLLSQLGQTGNQQINQQEKQNLGNVAQNLTSRGLANSTVLPTMEGGVQKNAQLERQSLNEGIAGQKIGAQMGLFNANPTPGIDTYMSMLSRLGNIGGR